MKRLFVWYSMDKPLGKNAPPNFVNRVRERFSIDFSKMIAKKFYDAFESNVDAETDSITISQEIVVMSNKEADELVGLLVQIRTNPLYITAETLVKIKELIIKLRGKDDRVRPN